MNSPILIISFVFLSLFSSSFLIAVEPPKEIAGFRLGTDITDYDSIEYTDYLKDVVVTDWYGFRKGIISYGTCAYPGEIVRISMKYEDSSKQFYQKLLKAYQQKYGKPTEWDGDPFGILFKWKWVFPGKDNQRVNLILQHNLKDPNDNIGNIVKLSYPEREEEERLCFIEYCEINKTAEEKEQIKERKKMNWEFMIPKS